MEKIDTDTGEAKNLGLAIQEAQLNSKVASLSKA